MQELTSKQYPWHEYFMRIAQTVSTRSTCLRRHYGSLIVRNNRIIGTGYNGAAQGLIECAKLGGCYRENNGIPHGCNYDSNCQAVHAECNAIINAQGDTLDSTIYIFGEVAGTRAIVEQSGPCIMCYRMIRNAGIKTIVYIENGEIKEMGTDAYGEKYLGVQL